MLYVHVPFCRSFCAYCSFYSERLPEAAGNEPLRVWLEQIKREISVRGAEIVVSHRALPTLYIGGGTPSLLPLPILEELLKTLRDAGADGFEEFTLELNPEDVAGQGPDYVRGLLRAGVNRFSMGVQSLSDPLLRSMHRRHDAARAGQAFTTLRKAGAENISVDLIFGLEELSDEELERTLEGFLEWRPEHISAYQLSVEPGCSWAEEKGRSHIAADEECARQYEHICRRLAEAGYRHYEISNWALPGREARHNSAYWDRTPYAGLGPAAHSFRIYPDGKQLRSWNAEALNWLEADGTPAQGGGREELTPEQIREERLMLGLRTAAGIDPSLLPAAMVAQKQEEGILETGPNGRLRIPERLWFVSDGLTAGLL